MPETFLESLYAGDATTMKMTLQISLMSLFLTVETEKQFYPIIMIHQAQRLTILHCSNNLQVPNWFGFGQHIKLFNNHRWHFTWVICWCGIYCFQHFSMIYRRKKWKHFVTKRWNLKQKWQSKSQHIELYYIFFFLSLQHTFWWSTRTREMIKKERIFNIA